MGTDWRTSLSASASSIRIVRGSASFARRWRFSSIFARRASEATRSEEHTSELQSHSDLVCRLLLEKKAVGRYKKERLPYAPVFLRTGAAQTADGPTILSEVA